MNRLRRAVEDSMNDIGLGTDERLDRAEERIRATVREMVAEGIERTRLTPTGLDGFDSWRDGFRQGWLAAKEAADRSLAIREEQA